MPAFEEKISFAEAVSRYERMKDASNHALGLMRSLARDDGERSADWSRRVASLESAVASIDRKDLVGNAPAMSAVIAEAASASRDASEAVKSVYAA